jgi:hypothetical protein
MSSRLKGPVHPLGTRRTDWLGTLCVPVDAEMAKDIWRAAQHGTVR